MMQMSLATTGYELVTNRTSKRGRDGFRDVRSVKSVDRPKANVAGAAGMSLPAARAIAPKRDVRRPLSKKLAANSAFLPFEHFRINSLCAGGVQTFLN